MMITVTADHGPYRALDSYLTRIWCNSVDNNNYCDRFSALGHSRAVVEANYSRASQFFEEWDKIVNDAVEEDQNYPFSAMAYDIHGIVASFDIVKTGWTYHCPDEFIVNFTMELQ